MKKKTEKPKANKKAEENPIHKMPFEEIIRRGVRVKPPVKKSKPTTKKK